jgi:dCTP deaminase
LILGRPDLLQIWKSGKLRFDPEIEESQIGLSSIDLRLGFEFSRHKPGAGLRVDPLAEDFDPEPLVETIDYRQVKGFGDQEVVVRPTDFLLARTLEKIFVPPNLYPEIQGRSTFARAGLSVHATAPGIEPGFRGPITLELHNVGRWDLSLKPGKHMICQLVCRKLTRPVSLKEAESIGAYFDQTVPFPKRNVGKKGKSK